MKDLNPIKKLPEILTLDDVAAYLKMLDDEQILAFKIRGTWRFRMNDIAAITRPTSAGKGTK
jgi:hypothetical protein